MPRLLCIALMILTGINRSVMADNVTWSGTGNGSWNGSNVWSPHLPGAGDDVFLNALAAPNGAANYTVSSSNISPTVNSITIAATSATLSYGGTGTTFTAAIANLSAGNLNISSGNFAAGTLNLTGGTLTLSASGTLTLGAGGGTVSGGTFAFSNGTLAGNALTVANGGFTWDNGHLQTTLNLNNGGALISGLGTKILDAGAALNFNGGTTTFVGNLSYKGNATATVGTGATLNIQADINLGKDSSYTGPASFTIQSGGILLRNTSTGIARITSGMTFANAGTIHGATGTIEIDSSLANSGTLQTDTGATIWTAGSTTSPGTLTFNAGSAITGSGTFLIQAATNTAGVLDLEADTAAASIVYLHTGTVQGSRTLTANGSLTWRNAIIGGSATVKATGGGTVIGSGTVSSGTMNLNAGTFTWSTGNITFAGNGKLQIDAAATLSNTGDNSFAYSSGSPILQNDGIIEKTAGTGTMGSGSGLTINNTSLIRILAGTLSVQGTINNAGTLTIASNAQIAMGGGTLNLNAGSDITGTGLLTVNSSSATLAVNATTNTTTSLSYVRGTINGSGTLTVNGAFNFGLYDGNTLAGSLTINAAAGGDWTSGGTRRISTATINLTGGTTNWAGADIVFTGSGALSVANGATLSLTGDQSITGTAGSPTVTVNGLFQKSVTTGNSSLGPGIAFTLSSTGTVDAASGNLLFQANTANNGTITASTGLIWMSSPITLTGTGLLKIQTAGTFYVDPGNSGTITIPSGMTFTNAGTVQIGSGTLAINSGALLSNYNASTSTLTGGKWLANSGFIDLGGRPIATIAANTTVEMAGGSAITGLTALSQNNGQLRLSSGATLTPAGTINTAGAFEASGTLYGSVTVQNGGSLCGAGIVTGSVTVQNGGKIIPGPGPYTAAGLAVLSVGNTALNGGAVYAWELNSWATNAGPGTEFDQLFGVTGAKLNLAGASSTNRITLTIASLNGSTPGAIPGFNPAVTRSWIIADYSNGNATGGIQNFSADKFTLDTSAFVNEVNSNNFSLSMDANSNEIILSYTPAPEPHRWLLAAATGLGLARIGRRDAKK